MSKIISIEPAIDPNARPTFLLDWELTLKCNLDCSYCPSDGPGAGHNNKTSHPLLDGCLRTIDFMYAYADMYMKYKPKWSRAVVLNVYGGEALYHPNIITILEEARKRHEPYQERWSLRITNTTNAIVKSQTLEKISTLIDEFTISYHAESVAKQKDLFQQNLALLKAQKKSMKCIIMMHSDEKYWQELLELIKFCQINDIRYIAKQIDGPVSSSYNQTQIQWFRKSWEANSTNRGFAKQRDLSEQINDQLNKSEVNLASVGRGCCGGRLMCSNEDLNKPFFFVPDNNFEGWNCSVNWFFLFVRQLTGEIYVNKDCRMGFDGVESPIGHLDRYQDLLETTKKNLESDNMPVISCAKKRCLCGLCAPKAKDKKSFVSIMKKHVNGIDFEV
jgi:pyruvate-formate lyase-activating enzyme